MDIEVKNGVNKGIKQFVLQIDKEFTDGKSKKVHTVCDTAQNPTKPGMS